MAFEGSESLLRRSKGFVEDHLETYLSSGGAEGHIVDVSHTGVDRVLPTLLLKTAGRRSGKDLIVPLIYGCYGGEWVVIASKAGAANHPAWYLNLSAQDSVQFQISTQCFSGRWRVAEGEERNHVWAYMETHFPPYRDYQESAGERLIPVIMLEPRERLPVFHQ